MTIALVPLALYLSALLTGKFNSGRSDRHRKEPGGGRLAAFAADLFRNTDNAGYRKPLLKGFQIPRICLEKILLALMDFSSADSSQDRV